MSMELTDKSTLVQVMAWCRQAPSHYLSQCWPRSASPYGVTRPQWVKHAHMLWYILDKGYCGNLKNSEHWDTLMPYIYFIFIGLGHQDLVQILHFMLQITHGPLHGNTLVCNIRWSSWYRLHEFIMHLAVTFVCSCWVMHARRSCCSK